ncbi:MAG: recombination mediator RecR [Planctomycetota bacterium]
MKALIKAHVGPVSRLMDELAKLPGVGKKSAERMAYHIMRAPADDAMALSQAVREVRERVRACRVCGSFAEEQTCPVCSDRSRDAGTVCVVEMPQDVAQIEKTGDYRGLYHVLMGRLSPLEDVGPKDIRVRELIARVGKGGVREVILATNPTAEGDATAAYLEKALRGKGVRVTRPARGLPAGSAIEFVDSGILGEAIRARRESGEDRT